MSDYAKLAELPLSVEGYELERNELVLSPEFTRVTTTVVVRGAGETGTGEDVTYVAAEHDGIPRDFPLAGGTFDDYSRALDAFDLPDYRRWAFESAGLDLALRQNGLTLGAAVGREYRPVRFVVSTRNVDAWLDREPSLEFKIDPASKWTREYMTDLAATGRVRVADLKGYYVGTPVDQAADPRLYADVVELFADAVIEDAAFTDETRDILLAAKDRLSFDAPIHSLADVHALEVEPRWLNIKPSRFGTVRGLLATLEFCEQQGIAMYGGGQFELGRGREQIQSLASLYYADTPNDVAPGGYNNPTPPPGLPTSPLPAPEPQAGF
jgi:hypothetical protein